MLLNGRKLRVDSGIDAAVAFDLVRRYCDEDQGSADEIAGQGGGVFYRDGETGAVLRVRATPKCYVVRRVLP